MRFHRHRMTLYDTIGQGYARTRAADPRITAQLLALLDLPAGSTVLDVGAGTGKYSRALAEHGYTMMALEPSEVMQAQAVAHAGVTFVRGSAEAIPLPDASAHGAIVVLALHHFTDRAAAFREMLRVVGEGPVVFLTFDARAIRGIWLGDYFPMLGRAFRSSYAELLDVTAEVERLASRNVQAVPFPLPRDLVDKFGAASWGEPEAYLREEVRRGISDFALMEESQVNAGLERLKQELHSGEWDAKYGVLRHEESYECGYKFLLVEGRSPAGEERVLHP